MAIVGGPRQPERGICEAMGLGDRLSRDYRRGWNGVAGCRWVGSVSHGRQEVVRQDGGWMRRVR